MIGKVAIIIERADIALGGAERSMAEVAQALSTLGVEVDLLAAKGPAGRGNVRVLCQDFPGKRVPLAVFGDALRRHLAHSNYDIIHSVLPFEFADLYQPRGGTYAESMRRNAASYTNPAARLYKRLTARANRRRTELLQAERKLCAGARGPRVAALSQYVIDQLQEHYRTDPGRIVLTLNGVDTSRRVDEDAAREFRRRLLAQFAVPQAQEPVLFLFAAHNFRLKGLFPLIRAMRAVGGMSTERPACLLVAGASKTELASDPSIQEHIRFLGPVQDVRSLLPAVDVGVLPTFYDPSSRFILETLAAGKPVITTRFNGATDHFTDGRHGRVIDTPDDVGALADALRHFTSTAHIEKAAQAIGEDDLASRISIHRVARDLLSIYEQLLTRKEHR